MIDRKNLMNILSDVVEAWERDANQGDGILDEDYATYKKAKDVINQSRGFDTNNKKSNPYDASKRRPINY